MFNTICFLIFCVTTVICGCLFMKVYKKHYEQQLKSLEQRLACVEQSLSELEKDYEHHILEY